MPKPNKLRPVEFWYIVGDELLQFSSKLKDGQVLGIVFCRPDNSFCTLELNEKHPQYETCQQYFKELIPHERRI